MAASALSFVPPFAGEASINVQCCAAGNDYVNVRVVPDSFEVRPLVLEMDNARKELTKEQSEILVAL